MHDGAIKCPQENEGFRDAFYKRGGLGVLQHALSSTKAAAGKLRRRALTLIGDLAHKVKVLRLFFCMWAALLISDCSSKQRFDIRKMCCAAEESTV